MALSGRISGTLRGREYRIDWTAVQSIVDNTSTITCVHKLINSSSFSLNISGRTNTCTVGDNRQEYISKAISTSGGTTITLGTTKHVIEHNNDGTKSVTITGVFNIKATLSGTYVAKVTATDTITLDTIPRSSSLSLSASSVNVGSTITANITRASSSFTHTVEFYIDSTYYKKYTSVETSQTYTIPTSWYDAMPSSTSRTAYCRITTYNGSTQIGEQVKKSFSVNVPSTIVPTVGTIELNPTDINGNNILVKGKNKLTFSVSGCSAGTGSTISSYTFSGPSISKTVSSTSASASTSASSISSIGTLTYKVTVTDARGRTASKTKTITCYDYYSPSLSRFNAYRADSDGSANVNGSYIQCTYTAQYASVNSTNAVTVTAYYSDSSTVKTQNGSNGSILINLNNDVNTTYKVYLKITDSYSGSGASKTITIFGQARILNVTADGTGVAIGKMAEENSLFECRWPAKFDGALSAAGNITTNADIGCTEAYNGGNFAVYCQWADGNHHDILVRNSDGVTTAIGWVGDDTNETVLDIRPQNVNMRGVMTAPYGVFTSTGDASVNTQNDVPLRVGTASAEHLDIDSNEIVAKDSPTTAGTLALSGANVDMYSKETLTLRVSQDETSGYIKSEPTYSRTYDASPNMYITSNGVLGRSTSSSKRYKIEIEDVHNDKLNPYKILDIPVRQYKYNEDNVPIGRQTNDLYLGLIAEEVEQNFPIAAEYNDEGQVEMWNIKVLFPALLKIVQEQQKEIKNLKNAINNIVGTSSNNME